MRLAVNTADVATPDELVTAVFTPPAKVPLAPLEGAAKVTVRLLMGLPSGSLTTTVNGAANALRIVVLWGVPLVAVMLVGQLKASLYASTLPIPVAKSQPVFAVK